MAQDLEQQTRDLAERLRQAGHPMQASQLARHLTTTHTMEQGLLFALREVCETLLTAVEAIDPVTQTMVENLRLEVEKRLRVRDAL
jgi:DNA-binding ferritin-like protein